jgi:hypothetical protein
VSRVSRRSGPSPSSSCMLAHRLESPSADRPACRLRYGAIATAAATFVGHYPWVSLFISMTIEGQVTKVERLCSSPPTTCSSSTCRRRTRSSPACSYVRSVLNTAGSLMLTDGLTATASFHSGKRSLALPPRSSPTHAPTRSASSRLTARSTRATSATVRPFPSITLVRHPADLPPAALQSPPPRRLLLPTASSASSAAACGRASCASILQSLALAVHFALTPSYRSPRRTNGLQGLLFSVLWKLFADLIAGKKDGHGV